MKEGLSNGKIYCILELQDSTKERYKFLLNWTIDLMQCQYKHKKDFFVDIRKADSNIYMKKQKKKTKKRK